MEKKLTVPKRCHSGSAYSRAGGQKRNNAESLFYNGQYVGYAAPAATPTPQAVQTAAAGTGENTSGTQTVQEEAEIPESETEEGLSDMSKILLGLMAVMVVTLVALMTALYFKREKNCTVPENRRRDMKGIILAAVQEQDYIH